MIPRLGEDPCAPFPPPEAALDEPDGLLAWGGDLAPERLLAAYRRGIFPWYSEDEPILWWCPSRRCVLPTAEIHVSRSLARSLRQGRFSLTADRAFHEVVNGCAEGREQTWITADMRHAYRELHELGYGHSIEVWEGGELSGGLYGLALGRMFFGESMYSRARDASKVAMVSLCRVLDLWGFPLMDCQLLNPHLQSMGAVLVSRASFLSDLQRLADEPAPRGSWTEPFRAALEAVSAGP